MGCRSYDLSPVSIQTQNFTQQTQAPANRNARSKQWQPWLAACQCKRLRFLRFSFTQRTQRKLLHLNRNRALGPAWTAFDLARLFDSHSAVRMWIRVMDWRRDPFSATHYRALQTRMPPGTKYTIDRLVRSLFAEITVDIRATPISSRCRNNDNP